jgi:hypothetical protein
VKKIYENFAEVAEDFTRGESITHRLSGHPSEECIGWQKGVAEFAAWLDNVGAKISQDPDLFRLLWSHYAGKPRPASGDSTK